MTDQPDKDDALSLEDAALLAQGLAPRDPDPGRAEAMKARILARVRSESAGRSGTAPEPSPAAPLFGAAAESLFRTVHTGDRIWQRAGPGVEMCTLLEDEHRRSVLVRIQPGGFLLPHQHDMDEESLLLEGDAWIGKETYLSPGDYHYSPAGAMHPLLESPQGCVVFVRCERRFRPRITLGLIERLVQGWSKGLRR